MKYDAEEQFILDALEKDEIQLSDPSKDALKAVKAAARNTFKKDKSCAGRGVLCHPSAPMTNTSANAYLS